MNEVVLNDKKKEEGVAWDQLKPGQLAEIVGPEFASTGTIVQRLYTEVVRSDTQVLQAVGGNSSWGDYNNLELRPLEPGESVTITVK